MAKTVLLNGPALSSGLYSYWKMDEFTGTRFDSISNNNLIDNNTVTSGIGVINSGAEFASANTEFLSLPVANTGPLNPGNTGDLSISVWVNPGDVVAQETICSVWDSAGSVNERAWLLFYKTAAPATWTWRTYQAGAGGPSDDIAWTGAVETGRFYHVVGIINRTEDFIALIVENQDSVTLSPIPPIHHSASGLVVGGTSNPSILLDGTIDEMGVWDRPLTTGIGSEVERLFNNQNAITYEEIVDGTSNIPANSTLTANLGILQNVSGTVDSTSTLNANLGILHHISGSITSVSTLSSIVERPRELSVPITSNATISASIGCLRNLDGTISGTTAGDFSSEFSEDFNVGTRASLDVTRNLVSTIGSASTVAGLLNCVRTINGETVGSSSLAANLFALRNLSASISSSSTISATLEVIKNVSSSIISQSTITASLAGLKSLQGTIIGTSIISPVILDSMGQISLIGSINATSIMSAPHINRTRNVKGRSLADRLIAYWRMEEPSGSIRYDSVGNRNLNDNNGVDRTSGIIGSGAFFNRGGLSPPVGSRQWLNLTQNQMGPIKVSGNQPFSFGGWFRLFDKTNTMSAVSVWDAIPNRSFNLLYNPSVNAYRFRMSSDGIDDTILQSQVNSLTTGIFRHVICRYDGQRGYITLSGVITNSSATGAFATGVYANHNARLNIGAQSSGTANWWWGRIDEVGFWNRFLSDNEVITLFNNRTGLPYSKFYTGFSTLSATLGKLVSVPVGNILSTSTLSASLSIIKGLVGTLNTISTISGDLNLTKSLVGSIIETTTLGADLNRSLSLSGTINGAGIVNGILSSVATVPSVTGDIILNTNYISTINVYNSTITRTRSISLER